MLTLVVGSLLYSVWLVLVAVFVVLVPAIAGVAVPVMVRVAVVPFASVGIVHTPLVYVPIDGVAVNPVGIVSSITMLVAVSGPLFFAVTV